MSNLMSLISIALALEPANILTIDLYFCLIGSLVLNVSLRGYLKYFNLAVEFKTLAIIAHV